MADPEDNPSDQQGESSQAQPAQPQNDLSDQQEESSQAQPARPVEAPKSRSSVANAMRYSHRTNDHFRFPAPPLYTITDDNGHTMQELYPMGDDSDHRMQWETMHRASSDPFRPALPPVDTYPVMEWNVHPEALFKPQPVSRLPVFIRNTHINKKQWSLMYVDGIGDDESIFPEHRAACAIV